MLKTKSKWTKYENENLPLTPTRSRFVPKKKKACALLHQHGISTGTISESKVLCSCHSMSYCLFHFSVYLLMTSYMYVNWQIWRHNSISFVAVCASRLCQIGATYTISNQYHNHIFKSFAVGWGFRFFTESVIVWWDLIHVCLSPSLSLCHVGD